MFYIEGYPWLNMIKILSSIGSSDINYDSSTLFIVKLRHRIIYNNKVNTMHSNKDDQPFRNEDLYSRV